MSTDTAPLSAPDACTIRHYIEYLAPSVWGAKRAPILPSWPPDMFAIVASLLNITGAYRKVLAQDAIMVDWKSEAVGHIWTREIATIGRKWREQYPPLDDRVRYPREVRRWWRTIVAHGNTRLCDLSDHATVYRALFNLMAASDEACAGVGFPGKPTDSLVKDPQADNYFLLQAADILDAYRDSPYGMTLCDLVHPSRLRVLPKLHTPRTGMTLRSLSLHLALCPADEVKITWSRAYGWRRLSTETTDASLSQLKHLNLLLVPWPMDIHPSDIHALPDGLDGKAHHPQYLFTYEPATVLKHKGFTILELIIQLLEQASTIIGVDNIHGIILPEMALTKQEYEDIKLIAIQKHLLLIAGIRGKANGYGVNQVGIYLTSTDFIQHKHHRWLLDAGQIATYGLVSKLHPDSAWWEGIEIAQRELRCLAINEWLCLCALICEDLARQDPMATAVRAIGPSLLIALLMDGPQLAERWSSHYATVLADDPGTSVLTFTSYGMVKLSHAMRPSGKHKTSRTVALWKDRETGIVEIDLQQHDDGLILCLTNKCAKEMSADGRVDQRAENLLVLGGVHAVSLSAYSDRRRGEQPPVTPAPVKKKRKKARVKSSAQSRAERFSS